MSILSGRFTQSPNERKRFILDYTLSLDAGEQVVSVDATVTSPTNAGPSPAFVCDDIVVAPGGIQVAYFAAYGIDAEVYLIRFLATTTLGKILEDVVEYDIGVKT